MYDARRTHWFGNSSLRPFGPGELKMAELLPLKVYPVHRGPTQVANVFTCCSRASDLSSNFSDPPSLTGVSATSSCLLTSGSPIKLLLVSVEGSDWVLSTTVSDWMSGGMIRWGVCLVIA